VPDTHTGADPFLIVFSAVDRDAADELGPAEAVAVTGPLTHLTQDQRDALLTRIVAVLDHGQPGGEWNADTFQDLGRAFAEVGVTFTGSDV
jgi:hypothetical protein